MYTRGDMVYADTYKYLKHKVNNIIALSYKGNADDFEELDMDLPIQVEVMGNMLFWNNRKLASIPRSMKYADIKENIIKGRYTYDEQIAIMLNREQGGELEYSRMQAWRDFATEIARIVDEEGYEAVTALAVAKEKKLAEVVAYDASTNVNSFTVSGIDVWLDKDTRAGLKLRFEAENAMGKTDTVLWYNGMQFPLLLTQAMQMLYAIEVYASACYDNTQRHIANVKGLSTVSEVDAYDYTIGYPEKLAF